MTRPDIWAVVPAAGRGTRFGGAIPKQYLHAGGQMLIAHALDALLGHPRVAGAMVALAADDTFWPGWTSRAGKPVLRCAGGADRAASVLAALHALPGGVRGDCSGDVSGDVFGDMLVLVHDAARPNLRRGDLDRLIDAAEACSDGAILAAPLRDTLKRGDVQSRIAGTEPRAGLWRALTPQAFQRGPLTAALEAARSAGVAVTDEAMAMERAGARPVLVEGRDDNLKVTTPADLALVACLLATASD